jgi:hypothetical protein
VWPLPVLSLGACAAVAPTGPEYDFAYRATRGPVQLYWNCGHPEPGLLQVEGVAISPYYSSPVQDLELRLAGVDARGPNVSRAQGAARDHLIPMMAQSPFRLSLRTAGTEVRFDLAFSYLLQEGGGMAGNGQPLEHSYVAKDVCPGEKR